MREDPIALGEATRVWARISLQTFGGPAGQIAVMHRTLVDEQRWIGQSRFTHAMSYCMLLPGPEAQQLATYTGWLLNGTRGALVAGSLFVLPGVVVLLAVSAVYVAFGETTIVEAIFAGVGPAVLAIVLQAVWRLGRRTLVHPALLALAVAAFAALAVFGVPFPLVVLAAGLIGWALGRVAPATMRAVHADDDDPGQPAPLIPDDGLHVAPTSARRTGTVLAVGAAVWLLPLLAAALLLGRDSVVVEQGRFFAGTALVTFGGAYAVLAFVAQRAVETYHWLSATDMVRGLALAESTPGPLIMVLQFVAFVGAYRDPGSVDPWVAATMGALLTTWVTFVPSFVFVLLGAPYVERLRGNHTVSAALTGVTAAVVGVIANLALYFAVHTLFTASEVHELGPFRVELPAFGSLDLVAVALTLVASWLVFARRWSVLRVLGLCALLGLAVAGVAATACA